MAAKQYTQEKFFVTAVTSNAKVINSTFEMTIVSSIRDKWQHILIVGPLAVLKQDCDDAVARIAGDAPLKGNIHYKAEIAENDDNSIEILRIAHGGGNNMSKRTSGGVVLATIHVLPVRGQATYGSPVLYPQYQEHNSLF